MSFLTACKTRAAIAVISSKDMSQFQGVILDPVPTCTARNKSDTETGLVVKVVIRRRPQHVISCP